MKAAPRAVVVVVDDEENVRATARTILVLAGHEVHVADSGRAALTLLGRMGDRVQVLLLDWTLPDLAGCVVLGEVRRLAPKTGVIVSTGFGRADVALTRAERDRVSFLEKPYSAAALLAAVTSVLSSIELDLDPG
jgi:DNA-binding NtrC family response regulator